jgi:malonate transporter MadM subunit
MQIIEKFIDKNGLIVAFLIVGFIMLFSDFISKKLTKGKIPTAALAIILALILAYFGGDITGGQKGIADLKPFAGMGVFGGAMFRDFAIVSTAFGASFLLMKKSGIVGAISLILGIVLSFGFGVIIAYLLGYSDPISLTTIGAGACTYIVGPITGAAIGASSDIIALSIGTGVVKAIAVAIATPFLAKKLGINNPQTAMIFGGLMGTNTGVMAGLAATDPKLVPYGALTATFYTGLGCLLCPSVFYILLNFLFS